MPRYWCGLNYTHKVKSGHPAFGRVLCKMGPLNQWSGPACSALKWGIIGLRACLAFLSVLLFLSCVCIQLSVCFLPLSLFIIVILHIVRS